LEALSKPEAALSVSLTAELTPPMLCDTWLEDCAAACTLRVISWVAAACCSIAAAIAVEISSTSAMVCEMRLMAVTTPEVSSWIAVIWERISSVAR
jgi:hypothetical protein